MWYENGLKVDGQGEVEASASVEQGEPVRNSNADV